MRLRLAAVVLLAAACSSSDTTTEDVTAPQAGPLETLLAALPAEDGEFQLSTTYQLVDLEGVEKASGVARPERAGATDADIAAWLNQFSTSRLPADLAPVQFTFPLADITSQGVTAADALGWSVLDARSVAWNLSNELTVLQGDFAEDSLSAALGEPVGSVWRVGNDSPEFTFAPGTARATSVRMGLDGSFLACAGSTADIERFLADGPTLGDSDAYREAVRVLDSVGAYTAVVGPAIPFSDEPFRRVNTRITDSKRQAWAESQPVPATFDVLAVGVSAVDGEPVATFVYRHADAAQAAANLPIIESVFQTGTFALGLKPYSNQISVQSAVTDGNLVIVTVTGLDDPASIFLVGETLQMVR